METLNLTLDEFMINTLRTVADNQYVQKSKLYNKGMPQKNRINAMIENGLILESKHGQYNVKEIRITEKGLTALQYAEKLQDILNDHRSTRMYTNFSALLKEECTVMKE
jgi:hypothetical protein